MKALNFNHNIDEIKSSSYNCVRGTLLVPKLYFKILEELTKSSPLSFEELIIKFSSLIEKQIIYISPIYHKHTTQYQNHNQNKEKLDLIRCHLRCKPMVWHHWKRLANHFGLSMCYLFLICLKKVSLKELESVGTPTESLHLHNFFFFEVTNNKKSYSHRWFYSRILRKIIKKQEEKK